MSVEREPQDQGQEEPPASDPPAVPVEPDSTWLDSEFKGSGDAAGTRDGGDGS